MGDFNIDLLHVIDIKLRRLGDLLETSNQHCSVNLPTRVTTTAIDNRQYTITTTVIDNIATNIPSVDVSLIVSNRDAQLGFLRTPETHHEAHQSTTSPVQQTAENNLSNGIPLSCYCNQRAGAQLVTVTESAPATLLPQTVIGGVT
ncbi:hypothetical protein J6590_058160 [Homalodisca vitripennis]|nr:hypothetical protein J6590_058160 [Homalodisca vitripennis]